MKRIILTLVLSFLSVGANAALVIYIFEGDLTTAGNTGDFSGLDGAHYERHITFESTDDPISTAFGFGYASLYYASVSDIIYLSNRPSPFQDQTIDVQRYDGTRIAQVLDYFNPSGSQRETLYFWSTPTTEVGQYPGDELSIGAVNFRWNYGENKFDGNVNGNKLLPLQLDSESVVIGPWVSNSGTSYSITNASASVVIIPVDVNIDIVDIDIRPARTTNTIHTNHNDTGGEQNDPVTVGVLGSSTLVGDPIDFAVADIDPATVRFGPAEGAIDPAKTPDLATNLDSDGLDDATFEFRLGSVGISCGETEATLKGETTSGQLFEGTDVISTVCNAGCH
jgi:hypothetical protein